MESGKIIKPEQNQEVRLVKKGFLYYSIKLITLPFKFIFFLFKLLISQITETKEITDHIKKERLKIKKLNKVLNLRIKNDGEII